MSKNNLALIENHQVSYEYVPTTVMSPEQTKSLVRKLEEMKKDVLRDKVDYMVIPGTPKPSLLKPGAERLLQCFGLGHRMTCTKAHEDWENGFFYYQYKATILKTYPTHEVIVAECEGSANSKESRYRDRWVTEKKARELGVNIAGCEYREKKGQYGAYREYKIENPDPFSIVNTLQKMAQKRALVGATLQATGSSGLFTQDLEDMEQQDISTESQRSSNPPARSQNQSQQQVNEPNALATDAQVKAMYAVGGKNGLSNDDVKALASKTFGREIASTKELTKSEASKLIELLQSNPNGGGE